MQLYEAAWLVLSLLFLPNIKFRIECIEVLGIQMFLHDVQPFAEVSNLRKCQEPLPVKGADSLQIDQFSHHREDGLYTWVAMSTFCFPVFGL